MPSCPHVSHQNPQNVTASGGLFSYCREGCSKTFFFCPSCGEANRTLARYCRACGEPVSFDELAGSGAHQRISGNGAQGDRHPLRGQQVGKVRALNSYFGHLLVIAEDAVLLLDPHLPHEPVRVLRAPAGSPVRGVASVETNEDRALLVTSTRQVYRQSILSASAAPFVVYQATHPSASVYGTALGVGGDVYLLEYNEQERVSRLIRAPGETVATFRGHARGPLASGAQRVFFCTDEKIFLYDAARGVLLEKDAPERLNPAAAPVYSAALEHVFLVGEMRLWRVDTGAQDLAPVPLAMNAVGDPRLCAGSDRLIMASTNDLFILDPFGDVKWRASEYFVNAARDEHAPQLFGDHFVFTGQGRLGGSAARIHSLHKPQDFEPVTYDKPLLCAPVLSLGRLFAVAGDEHAPELVIS